MISELEVMIPALAFAGRLSDRNPKALAPCTGSHFKLVGNFESMSIGVCRVSRLTHRDCNPGPYDKRAPSLSSTDVEVESFSRCRGRGVIDDCGRGTLGAAAGPTSIPAASVGDARSPLPPCRPWAVRRSLREASAGGEGVQGHRELQGFCAATS